MEEWYIVDDMPQAGDRVQIHARRDDRKVQVIAGQIRREHAERIVRDHNARPAEGAACERMRAALRQAEKKLFHCSVGHGVADHQGYPCNLAGEARLIMIEALKQHQDDNDLDSAPDPREGA